MSNRISFERKVGHVQSDLPSDPPPLSSYTKSYWSHQGFTNLRSSISISNHDIGTSNAFSDSTGNSEVGFWAGTLFGFETL